MIVVGSILIMATIYLLKKLHTPHDFVLFAIAVVDLVIGVVTCPLYLLKVVPETFLIVGAHRWPCILISGMRVIIDNASFDLLTLMCIDRFLMIWKPIWYKTHVTKRVIVMSILGVLVFRAITFILFIILNFIGHQDIEWSSETCKEYNFASNHLAYVINGLFVVSFVISCGLCIKAVIIALGRHSKRKVSASDYGEYARVKLNVILMSSLIFIFWILRIPTLASIISLHMTPDSRLTHICLLNDLSRAILFINSGVNALVYATTRRVYRTSFKFLLTTPPWKWRDLPKWQLRQEIVARVLVTAMSCRPDKDCSNKCKASHIDHYFDAVTQELAESSMKTSETSLCEIKSSEISMTMDNLQHGLNIEKKCELTLSG